MANQVCMGAMCQCSFGAAPSTLVVTPENKTLTCSSLANPTVAAATSAALGVLTPMPCVPVIAAPWAPGCPTVLIANKPALNDSSKLMCNWGGVISINNAGQMKHQIP